MATYLMNTLITPVNLDGGPKTVRFRRISAEDAAAVLRDGFISAVGHAGTAQVLSAILGTQVEVNRVTIQMRPGDRAVHFALRARLPEGAVLSAEELSKLDYDLVLSEVIE